MISAIYFILGIILDVEINFSVLAIFFIIQILFLSAYYYKKGTQNIIFGICAVSLVGITILAYGSGGIKSAIFPWFAPVLMLSIMLTRYQKKHLWLSGLVMLVVIVFSLLDYISYPMSNQFEYINSKELCYINMILVFTYIFIVSFYYEKMLNNLSRQRKKILSALSHDLKTPLSVILMTSQVLRSKMTKDPMELNLEKLDRIERACESLLTEIKKLREPQG